jgi:hypothetical protein
VAIMSKEFGIKDYVNKQSNDDYRELGGFDI